MFSIPQRALPIAHSGSNMEVCIPLQRRCVHFWWLAFSPTLFFSEKNDHFWKPTKRGSGFGFRCEKKHKILKLKRKNSFMSERNNDVHKYRVFLLSAVCEQKNSPKWNKRTYHPHPPTTKKHLGVPLSSLLDFFVATLRSPVIYANGFPTNFPFETSNKNLSTVRSLSLSPPKQQNVVIHGVFQNQMRGTTNKTDAKIHFKNWCQNSSKFGLLTAAFRQSPVDWKLGVLRFHPVEIESQ